MTREIKLPQLPQDTTLNFYKLMDAYATAAVELDRELAKPEQSPAWHDAPTCAGLWVCLREDRHKSYRVHKPNVWVTAPEPGDRWYGPIPEDKP